MPTSLRSLLLGVMLCVPGLAQAATSALVIGINEYTAVPSLDGARNDAEDIATALRRNGTTRIVKIMDRDATKQNILDAWTTLLNDAKEGDTIFVTYAGHGAQIKQVTQGDENDGLDEFWVLPGFNPKNLRETWRESVFDNELHEWFTEAGRRGIKVVLVSDSCHAGGMNRAVKGKLRYVEFGNSRVLGELLAMVSGSAGTAAAVSEPESRTPANVTMLAATSEALPVPEVVIEGRSRGALSWAFARAVEGKSDRDGDGAVTRIELEDYVLATVRMRSESLQTPVFTPVAAREAAEVLFGVTHLEEIASTARPAEKTGRRPMVRARELGFEPVLPLTVKGTDVTPEDIASGNFPYEWDASTGLFRSPNGEVVAEKVSTYTVNDIVSKFILLDFLKAVASQNPGKIIVSPEKQVYLASEHIKFDAVRGDYKNMLVFNLANTGEVQLLDMIIDGEPQYKTPLREMKIVEPFGSDHLVVVSSNESLEAIGRMLERGVTPKELLATLSQRIDGTDSSIAILPLYTRTN